jgi:hypothetical protein
VERSRVTGRQQAYESFGVLASVKLDAVRANVHLRQAGADQDFQATFDRPALDTEFTGSDR